MRRHDLPTPEEVLETRPPALPVAGGDVVRVLDPASGGINFYNGDMGGVFGPEGNSSLASSSITYYGSISGYKGTEGALTGVFLDAAIPSGSPAPATLDFSSIGRDFTSLSPDIGQVFFVGDGETSSGAFHQFIAPSNATRLFLGIPDAFGFDGVPGSYDDNDGSYSLRVGVNEAPAVPLPAGGALLLTGLAALGAVLRITRARG